MYIAMNLNRGNVSPDYTHYVFYTSDYGENLQIITANNVGLTAYALFGCDEQMTKMVYMTHRQIYIVLPRRFPLPRQH
jgi:hypothetical protein